MTGLFYGAAGVAVLAAALVITRRSYMHALVFLVLFFLAIGTLLFSLGAPFAAALQVMVYAGAIMVLFVFSILLLRLPAGAWRLRRWTADLGWALPVLFVGLLAGVVAVALLGGRTPPEAPAVAAVVPAREVGLALFGRYLLGVELASLLLLAGLAAAFHFGERLSDAPPAGPSAPSASPAASPRQTAGTDGRR
ncbi:MAG: NADH-quinone oxidoreductase subunit J [Myxococcota bacterium]|jgi:NADH-quinone oxidoreductase subunit J|nr:NADH-quinone oxidoreductase subunit J [Myxococcota bacterium]